jgi:hypothetical protein
MGENNWIRNNADFGYINRKKHADIITIKNSDNLETEFYLYSKNFHCAANQITDYLLTIAYNNNDIGKLDTWFFAIIYLYRQSLELILKAIVFVNITDRQIRTEILRGAKHDLMKCFHAIKKYLPVSSTTQMLINIQWLEEFLENISSVDRQSDMFRYPFNHRMEIFFTEQTHIDIFLVQQNLNTAYNILCDLYIKEFSGISYELNTPKLIINGGAYFRQSVVGYKFFQNDFYPFIKGYQESANLLKDIMLTELHRATFFLPMCYLYRNTIELGLKRILLEDCRIPPREALSIIYDKKHSVLGLWEKIKCEIEKHANAPEGDTTVVDAERYIRQLHNIDSDSTKFRYPTNMSLQFHFQREKKFSVENISDCFNDLIEFLDAVDGMLSQIREWEAEMEAEIGNDFSDYYGE